MKPIEWVSPQKKRKTPASEIDTSPAKISLKLDKTPLAEHTQ
jgi:hypothetical protein